ncbi:gamma-carotene hydroxylase [Flavobacteria bacterium BBFL7]|nr:gamma-carotene hydroxylase [Flavobacteria bacterium BBFL7]
MNITIQKYYPKNAIAWNTFIRHSCNGTFLLNRNFMDYHQDRFEDASLMVYDNDLLVACVPGNEVGDHFYSHQGLTYGGIFMKVDLSIELLKAIVTDVVFYLKSQYLAIQIKWQPEIYNSHHVSTIEQFNILGFNTVHALHNLHVDLKSEIKISSKKTSGYRNGKFDHLTLKINNDFSAFWNAVLQPQLKARHQAHPVHSIEEIELLASRFPNQIKQSLVYQDDELIAGVTFFIKGNIVKSQYAAATIKGMKTSALDYLYIEMTKDFKDQNYQYIDYGHVNEIDGTINRGLQRFKEELGAINQPVFSSQWSKI